LLENSKHDSPHDTTHGHRADMSGINALRYIVTQNEERVLWHLVIGRSKAESFRARKAGVGPRQIIRNCQSLIVDPDGEIALAVLAGDRTLAGADTNARYLSERHLRAVRRGHDQPAHFADRAVYDPADQDMKDVAVYHRDDLVIGSLVPGPAVIAEDETTTIVPKSFAARLSPIGAILLEKVGT